jgi:cation:H+ antiporter
MISVWLKFIVCAVIIFYSGKRVAKYGDIIAEKTGLGGLWIGVVLVALATSLPEIFTGIGSIVFVGAPDLTVGNLFGANTYNLLNIAILDFLHKGAPLLSAVSIGQLLTGGLSLLPLLVAAIGLFLSSRLPQFGFANISLYSILILVLYFISIRTIFKFESKQQKILKETDREMELILKYEGVSLRKAFVLYGFFALIIVGSGIWLAYIGDELVRFLGLGQNFVGSLFLGLATTLPEISVSMAALRLGAKEMAVANMLGSNLFNMVIIFINDVFYRKGPIFGALSQDHILSAFIVIFMTIILVTGLILKPKKKTRLGFSAYSFGLIAVFIIGAYLNFTLVAK